MEIDKTRQPQRPLCDERLRMWNHVWGIGRTWVSAYSDIEHLLMLCESIDERQQLRTIVIAGDAYWRERVALRTLDAQIASMLGVMGFNPAERSKMGVAEVQPESALDKLRAAREANEK